MSGYQWLPKNKSIGKSIDWQSYGTSMLMWHDWAICKQKKTINDKHLSNPMATQIIDAILTGRLLAGLTCWNIFCEIQGDFREALSKPLIFSWGRWEKHTKNDLKWFQKWFEVITIRFFFKYLSLFRTAWAMELVNCLVNGSKPIANCRSRCTDMTHIHVYTYISIIYIDIAINHTSIVTSCK